MPNQTVYMSRLLKPYFFIFAVSLTLVLLAGPPLAIAKNLPTRCNLFNKKMADNKESCAHRSMISKIQDKSFVAEAIIFSNAGLEVIDFLMIPSSIASVSFSSRSHTVFNPLRC